MGLEGRSEGSLRGYEGPYRRPTARPAAVHRISQTRLYSLFSAKYEDEKKTRERPGDDAGDSYDTRSTGAPRGYVQKRHMTTRAAAAFARDAVADLDSATQRLFFHLIACAWAGVWEDGWTPLSAALIKKYLRGASWKRLAERGLIQYTDYWYTDRESREYRVEPNWLAQYLALAQPLEGPLLGSELVDLFTGRPTTSRHKTRLRDDQRNPIAHPTSPLMRALRHLKSSPCYFLSEQVEAHLAAMEERIHAAYTAWIDTGEPAYTAAFEAYLASFSGPSEALGDHLHAFEGERFSEPYKIYKRRVRQWANDAHCYRAVLDQGPVPAPGIGPGVWSFIPAYAPQMSGRLGCLGGMLQSCSREMKYAAFTGVPGLRNYDRVASQPRILIQKMREAMADGAKGVDVEWLEAYQADPASKYAYARRTGLPVDAWKAVLMAVVNAASLPRDPATSKGDVVKIIRDAVGEAELGDVYRRVCRELGPLKRSLDAWHRYLIGPYVDARSESTRRGRGVRNDAGRLFYPKEVREAHKRKARMSAFVLQGAEAAHMHELTCLGPAYGFQVLQNEHDGLIVLGEIPERAMQEAAEKVGLESWELVEKPFCDRPLVDAPAGAAVDVEAEVQSKFDVEAALAGRGAAVVVPVTPGRRGDEAGGGTSSRAAA